MGIGFSWSEFDRLVVIGKSEAWFILLDVDISSVLVAIVALRMPRDQSRVVGDCSIELAEFRVAKSTLPEDRRWGRNRAVKEGGLAKISKCVFVSIICINAAAR